jgi:hypothetical protein
MSVALVHASGTAHDIGRAHGRALADRLRAFLDDGLARLNHLGDRPLSLPDLLPAITAHRSAVTAAAPALAQEVAGLAEGAGITEDQAWLLQLRREVIGSAHVPSTGDCTAYARTGAPGPVLAQTVDLNAHLDDSIAVLRVRRAGSSRRVLVLSFAGLLCYLGLNSDGLAIGINLVTDGRWRPGIPPYLAIRHLLDTTSGVDEALEVLAGLRLSSSRNLMLCDRRRTVFVEAQGEALRVSEPASKQAVHTNHYLHPDFLAHDRQTPTDRISSDRRLLAATRGLASMPPGADAEEHFALLSEPPLNIPDHGHYRLERTVAAVVMFPATGQLHLRPGDPSRSRTHVFTL